MFPPKELSALGAVISCGCQGDFQAATYCIRGLCLSAPYVGAAAAAVDLLLPVQMASLMVFSYLTWIICTQPYVLLIVSHECVRTWGLDWWEGGINV